MVYVRIKCRGLSEKLFNQTVPLWADSSDRRGDGIREKPREKRLARKVLRDVTTRFGHAAVNPHNSPPKSVLLIGFCSLE